MPLYEYECDSCGHRFEVIQKYSDALIDKCPKCGATVHKLMSSPAIQFKGSGWYITDYARKDSTSATKAGTAKEGSTTGEGGSSGSSGTTGATGSSESGSSKPAASTPPSKTKPD